jgi:hypothetical protein
MQLMEFRLCENSLPTHNITCARPYGDHRHDDPADARLGA